MKSWLKISLTGLLCVTLASCASSSDDAALSGNGGSAASFGLGADDMNGDTSELYAAGAKSDPRITVYFDFDKYAIEAEYQPVIVRHANYLIAHPHARVRIEGHTDEVGSREYNIALGERRAEAVKKALIQRGVAVSQLSTVSYGMEYPVAECATLKKQRCQLNRRAIIVLTGKG